VTVGLRGGRLRIDWPRGGSVLMTGPAVAVFEGDVAVPGSSGRG
jgi:diaminopimelate epimerase